MGDTKNPPQKTANLAERPNLHSIVFFDGVCSLCNRSVDFLMRVDSRQRLLFAPLQGATAAVRLQGLVADQVKDALESVVFLEDERIHLRSAAVVQILWILGGPWAVLSVVLALIPSTVRDRLYDMVAKSRYRIFGKRETCRVPTPDERARFLD